MNTNRPWLGLTANNEDGNYTDLVSNSVILDGLDLLSESKNLLQQLATPQYLRPFLHEKTHHTTFDSPVGLAISALYVSCVSMQFERIIQGATLPIRDLTVLYATYHLLEPLIEGLAVFAEHDSVPRNSPVWSSVAISATQVIFSETDNIKKLFIDGQFVLPRIAFEVFLRDNRLRNEWTEQKAFLLKQEIAERPFYLLGYLAVKGIYRALLTNSSQLADPELFMVLMIDYWFHDEKFAELLLRIDGMNVTDEEIGINLVEISEYIQDRFDELYQNVEKYAEECEIYFAQDEERRKLSNPPSYRNYSANGNSKLKHLHGFRTATISINLFQPKIFKFRREFRFSSQLGKVLVNEKGKGVLSINNSLIEIPTVPNADLGDYEVSIEGVQHGKSGDVLVIISGGSGLVALKNINNGEWNSPQMVEYFDEFPSALVINWSMKRFAQSHILDENSKYKEMLDFYIEQSKESAIGMYPQLAFRIRGEALNRVVVGLSQNGFRNILNENESKKLAEYSLLCGAGAWNVREHSRIDELDENLIFEEIAFLNTKIKEKIGVDVFLINRDIGAVMSYL